VTCEPRDFTRNLPGLVSRIEAEQFDALLDFSNWPAIARLASRLPGIPVRAIAYDRTRNLALQRFKNALPWFRPFNTVVEIDDAVHRATKYQRLIREALGWTLTIDWPLAPVKPAAEPLTLFVHPHASKSSKQWKIERFVSLLTKLRTERRLHCYLNEGHAGERQASEALASALEREDIGVTLVRFDPSCVALEHALGEVQAAIGLDSGPMHFASLVGVPTLVIYGPYEPTEVAPLFRSLSVRPPGRRGPTRTVREEDAWAGVKGLLGAIGAGVRAPGGVASSG
jgi:ADP-heptose:LPS heptosyltransferase